MNRGDKSFLTNRSAREAWPLVLRLFQEERFNQCAVAKRLGVHYVTVYRWRQQNPKYAERLRELHKKLLENEVL